MKNFFADFFENKTKIVFTLVLIPLLLYKKALFYGFSPMDEQWLIEDNSAILGSWQSIKKIFSEPTAFIFYRPFFMFSLIVDYHLGKLDAFFYHFSNLVFHLLNVVLMFYFLLGFKVKNKTAFSLSLLFAVHPIALHTVVWIPGRNDSMLCIFVLCSFIFLLRNISTHKIIYFLWHLLFFAFALFTKENAIALPFIFLLFLYFNKNEGKTKIGIYVFLWLFTAFSWFILRKNITNYMPLMQEGLMSGLKNVAHSFLVFIGKTIFPLQQSVFPTLKNSSILPGLVTLVLYILGWVMGKPQNKKIAFIGLTLFSVLLIIPVFYGALRSPGEQYEHRIYTSMAGILLFLSQLEFKISSKRLRLVFIILITLLGTKTYLRMGVYKNKLSFLEAGINDNPDYYYFHLTKGEILYKNKDNTGALASFNRAIALNPGRPQSYNSRANVYFTLERYREAINDYTKAIEHKETNVVVLMQRCIAYYNLGDIENAMADLTSLKKCCQSQIHPDMEKTLTEKWEIEQWNRKIKSDPKNANLYVERARFFLEKRMGKEALADLEKACQLEPKNTVYKGYLNDLSSTFPH